MRYNRLYLRLIGICDIAPDRFIIVQSKKCDPHKLWRCRGVVCSHVFSMKGKSSGTKEFHLVAHWRSNFRVSRSKKMSHEAPISSMKIKFNLQKLSFIAWSFFGISTGLLFTHRITKCFEENLLMQVFFFRHTFTLPQNFQKKNQIKTVKVSLVSRQKDDNF